MSLNRTLLIMGTPVSVVERTPDSVDEAGYTDWLRGTIVVSPELNDQGRVFVFYHELIHVMLEATGLSHTFTAEQNEALADGLGHALMRVISDNKTLPALARINDEVSE